MERFLLGGLGWSPMRYLGTIGILGGMALGIAFLFVAGPGHTSSDRVPPARTGRDPGQGIAAGPIGTTAIAGGNRGGTMKKATFGAGCFWGVEAAFRRIPGVIDTAVGYSGGHTENPTYKEVCTDRTGHAEVVEVRYDPSRVTYQQLLEAFWSAHDPTQVNRQGPDYGTQYRTVIFYHDDEQKADAEASRQALESSGRLARPVATQVVPAGPFYRAEEYHQRYLEKRGLESCHL